MPRAGLIEGQLKITKALIKFLRDHEGGVSEHLEACLKALEKKDIQSAVQHARMVKPHGMGGITDWWSSVIHANETADYNEIVLVALVNHWCHMMSFSFDELDHVKRDLQVGALEAQVNSKGFVCCPFCQKTFLSRDSISWDGSTHTTCGVRLKLVAGC